MTYKKEAGYSLRASRRIFEDSATKALSSLQSYKLFLNLQIYGFKI